MQYLVKDIIDWKHVAESLLPSLTPGTILTLSGPLGAGKTTFVQALAEVLGAKSIPRSPTFSLVRSYKLPITNYELPLHRLVHVDAYRIERPEDIIPLNLEEELEEPGTLMVIEWPENISSWLDKQKTAEVRMVIDQEDDERRVEVTTP